MQRRSSLLDEGDVLLEAADPDPTFVALLRATKPGAGAPVHGADVEVVAEADDPDRHWLAQRAIAPE